ncbi:MAG: SpoIIE family protein phosphatase [Candidatus Velthaea sp.]
MENIATAPVAPGERKPALWLCIALVAGCIAIVPFSTRPFAQIPAVVPALVGAAVLAQLLTAVLLFVQWRISRQAQLALLAIAFAGGAIVESAWALAYPNVFSPQGLLGAKTNTVGWLFVLQHGSFATLIVACALLERTREAVSRRTVRIFGVSFFVVVLAAVYAAIAVGDRLPASVVGNTITPLWRNVVAPLLIAEFALAIGLLAATGVRTVAHVWLIAVCLAYAAEVFAGTMIAGSRFSIGWYAGRAADLAGSFTLLVVFLFKINDLLVRLSSRNRTLTERSQSDAIAIAEGEERYRSLANAVPQLIWATDASGNVQYVNDRWVAYIGHGPGEAGGDALSDAIHSDHRADWNERWGRSLRTGKSFSAEYRLREGTTGDYRWFLVNAIAARDWRGVIVRWIGTCTDIDIAKRLEEREAFLASAGDRLAESLSVATTLGTIRDLAVSRLCDWCKIDLIDDDGRFVVAASDSTDPEEGSALSALLARPVESPAQATLAAIAASGEPVVIRDPAMLAETLGVTTTVDVRNHLRSRTAIVVPLLTGEDRIGTLSLVYHADRRLTNGDIALAREFARRAALSLAHARLYERERTTADALQRAMLPAQLPILPDLRFSASYSAASESQRVGGDFYDAFTLPDGRVAVTIGDVTGHGLEAAVIMGEIRQALRAASFDRSEPSAILDRASRLLVASGRTVFVTAIFGVLDTETGMFAYSTAGHPPPLLFDGARVVRLASSGLPIGLREDDGVDFSLVLHAPCTLILYTDGLLEFGRDLDEGERRIEAAVGALAPAAPDHLASAIMKRVLANDQATDDIAILTATIARFAKQLPGDTRTWRFLSTDARAAAIARREIGELVARTHPGERFAAELAFGELVANVVRYAPGPLTARCALDPDGAASISVEDTGHGFTGAPSAAAADEFAERGRGIALLRALCEDVRIGKAAGGGASVSVRVSGAR